MLPRFRHQRQGEFDRFFDGRIVVSQLAIDRAIINCHDRSDRGSELLGIGSVKGPAVAQAIFREQLLQLMILRAKAIALKSRCFDC